MEEIDRVSPVLSPVSSAPDNQDEQYEQYDNCNGNIVKRAQRSKCRRCLNLSAVIHACQTTSLVI